MWRRQSEWEEIVKKAVEKLFDGKELDSTELEALATKVEYGYFDCCEYVNKIDGDDHRWRREVSTIIKTGDRYWRIDWMRGLTEDCDDDFWEQPVEVRPETRVIPAHEVTEYVEV